MIEYLRSATLWEVLIFATVVNALTYLLSIGVYHVLTLLGGSRTIQPSYHQVTSADIVDSLITVACNTAVFLLGHLLWKKEVIVLMERTLGVVFIEIIVFIMVMDFAMYVFHRIAHSAFVYAYIHKRHHEHEATNAISLFVLHPVESLGFGGIMISILMLHSFSDISVVVYMTLNLLWGTIGHMNVEIFPLGFRQAPFFKWIGTATFHNAHHQHPTYNFGFYTYIWDKLFRTSSS